MRDDEPVVDGGFGLPDRDGFEAVLEAEQQPARRRGGTGHRRLPAQANYVKIFT